VGDAGTTPGSCRFPGCERPSRPNEIGACALHVAEYDARSELNAWNWAESILEPWVETTEAIGSEELTRVMTEALDEVRRQVARHSEELERAMAALEGKGIPKGRGILSGSPGPLS
jgi:hypothetical protein